MTIQEIQERRALTLKWPREWRDEEIDTLFEEITRLREERQNLIDSEAMLQQAVKDRDEEIARLQQAVRDNQAEITRVATQRDQLNEEIERLDLKLVHESVSVEAFEAAVAAERERCAQIAERFYDGQESYWTVECGHASADIAAVLRAPAR